MKKYLIPIAVILFVLCMDQWLKYWVHTHIYESHKVIFPNWFMLYYTENNGMAFGLEFGGIAGKIILTVFRIVAVFGLIWYIVKQIKLKAHLGFIICVSLILAGAVGNILDSVFYGIVYRSQNLPLFQGRVIDMLYFPIFEFTLPDSSPFRAGEHFMFFRPVFNIADAVISIGIITIIVFQNEFFKIRSETSGFNIDRIDSLKDNQGLAKLTVKVFLVAVIVNIVALSSYFLNVQLLNSILFFLQWSVNIFSFILFLNWFTNTYSNLHRLELKNLSYTRYMTIWGFFIPLVCFVRPNIIMREIWSETQKVIGEVNPEDKMKKKGYFINWWWFALLFTVFIGLALRIFSGYDAKASGLIFTILHVLFLLLTINVIKKVSEEEKLMSDSLNVYLIQNPNLVSTDENPSENPEEEDKYGYSVLPPEPKDDE